MQVPDCVCDVTPHVAEGAKVVRAFEKGQGALHCCSIEVRVHECTGTPPNRVINSAPAQPVVILSPQGTEADGEVGRGTLNRTHSQIWWQQLVELAREGGAALGRYWHVHEKLNRLPLCMHATVCAAAHLHSTANTFTTSKANTFSISKSNAVTISASQRWDMRVRLPVRLLSHRPQLCTGHAWGLCMVTDLHAHVRSGGAGSVCLQEQLPRMGVYSRL